MDDIKKLYVDGINNHTLSKTLVKRLAHEYLLKNDLQNDVRSMFLYDNILPGYDISTLGYFNPNTNTLSLSNTVIMAHAIQSPMHMRAYKKGVSQQSLLECRVYYYLTALYHELTHAKQHKLSKAQNTMEATMIHDTFEFGNNHQDAYISNHDLFPIEHNANASGTLEATNFNNKYGEHFIISSHPYITSLLDGYQVRGNKVISPIERLFLKTKAIEVVDIINYSHKFNLLTRLEYGLPISINEYRVVTDRNLLKNDVSQYRNNVKTLSKCIK